MARIHGVWHRPYGIFAPLTPAFVVVFGRAAIENGDPNGRERHRETVGCQNRHNLLTAAVLTGLVTVLAGSLSNPVHAAQPAPAVETTPSPSPKPAVEILENRASAAAISRLSSSERREYLPKKTLYRLRRDANARGFLIPTIITFTALGFVSIPVIDSFPELGVPLMLGSAGIVIASSAGLARTNKRRRKISRHLSKGKGDSGYLHAESIKTLNTGYNLQSGGVTVIFIGSALVIVGSTVMWEPVVGVPIIALGVAAITGGGLMAGRAHRARRKLLAPLGTQARIPKLPTLSPRRGGGLNLAWSGQF